MNVSTRVTTFFSNCKIDERTPTNGGILAFRKSTILAQLLARCPPADIKGAGRASCAILTANSRYLVLFLRLRHGFSIRCQLIHANGITIRNVRAMFLCGFMIKILLYSFFGAPSNSMRVCWIGNDMM